ncbi:hypothetical protein JCM14469_23780 [Desulfatiferula olefinivorans]
MARKRHHLKLLFYFNIAIVGLLIGIKVYLHVFSQDFEAVHADQIERIEAALSGKSSYRFIVVGNINNSVGIFERKILPLINKSGADFMISAGNAVRNGGDDKYRALYGTLSRLSIPYLLTFGENEYSAIGSFRFYDHFGPYHFSFSAAGSRFIFLDSTGKTSWAWQYRWLDEELALSNNHVFVFSGHPIKEVDRTGVLDFDNRYLLDERARDRFAALIEGAGVDAVFSSNLPLFSRQTVAGTDYVVTGGAGGLVLNNDRSYYHYITVDVDKDRVVISPERLSIGQHPVFRTLESLWFFVHSLVYVGYMNFLLLISVLIIVAIWLYVQIFTERDYYPNFDLDIEPFLNRPLKVAMFANTLLPFVGGVPVSVDRLRQGLKAMGHKVLVAGPRFPDTPETDRENDTLRLPLLIPFRETSDYPIVNIFSLRLFRTVFAFRPDIVHLHHPFWLGRMGLFIARRLKVPAIYTYHTRLEHFSHFVPLPEALFRNLISHRLIRRFANRCDGVVVPTEAAEDYLRIIGVKRPIFVQPTGIDYDSFARVDERAVAALRTRLGLNDKRIVISVSRLSREKNIGFILDAVHELSRRQSTPFTLLIIGDGPEREALDEKIRVLGLENRVRLLGAVSPMDIPVYYHLGDVFVFASRAETQGMVILEAMAAGLPVVAVRSSGIDEFVQNDMNGYKTRLNPALWCEPIERLLTDETLRKTLSDNAGRFARSYSIERFGYDMTRVYAHIFSARVKHPLPQKRHHKDAGK